MKRRRYRQFLGEIRFRADSFTQVIGLSRFAMCVFDYGAPVGFRLAARYPERLTAIISQNGSA
jgi:pimeloyl-ACP methyl ester carboxylesterase